eukprot:Clim_evm52s22 gene=Clim_evmTU52s22
MEKQEQSPLQTLQTKIATEPHTGHRWTHEEVRVMRFGLAAVSNVCGATFTNPVDVMKVRLQLQGEGTRLTAASRTYNGWISGMYTIARNEGISGLYKGLAAANLREATYSGLRMGSYELFKEMLGAHDRRNTPLHIKMAASAMGGIVGASITNPTDLIKVRMQADINGTRYRNVADAFMQIWRQEGFLGLYTGVGPTVMRAALVTMGQLTAYDHSKHTILDYELLHEGFPLHMAASMIAGFVGSGISAPMDTVKSRIMNQPKENPRYTGTLDCIRKTIRAEGPLALYKGFLPNWMRLGPHTIVSFMVFEQLRAYLGVPPV